MENIDNWEVVSDEQMGAYLSDKRDSINISSFDDGVDARYSYEVDVEKKDYRNYFGKIQHNYQDIKRNPLSTFSRNAWNGLLDLPRGLGDAIIGAGEYVAFKTVGGDPEFEKRLAEGANALRAKNAEWFKQYEYINNQQDNTFVADLGRAGGSLVSALGLSFITRNPTAVAGAFGASQFGSINKELRERGVDIDRTLAISTGLGLAEGVLERIGLHLWFENAATKKISSYLLKQGATEFTQEASQTAVEEVSMKLLGERDTEWFDIVKNVIYSGVIGGITGIGGGAVSIPSTEAFKKQAKERLVEKGFTEEKAQQLVDDAAYSNEEARRDLIELVNKEADQSTLLNGSYEDDVKAFSEAMKQDVVAEAFDIKQRLKETAMTEGGLDEETAEVASTLVENFTKVMYNETGQTPLEQFEEQGLTIIDERYPSPQDEVVDESELTEEEIARLDAKEKEEFDIPFQTDQLRPGDEGYYQSDRVVNSVFDLRVGDRTKELGVVNAINYDSRQIKIGGTWYDMLRVDTQANQKGMTILRDVQEQTDTEVENIIDENYKKASENRDVVNEQKAKNTEYNEIAKDYFGITNNLDLGGYILTDGNLLDLSGKKFGSDGGTRSIDHREISDAWKNNEVSMEDFINSGNIRYMPESNSILMADIPNSKQYKIISQIINRASGEVTVELMSDANNWGSDKDFSRTYEDLTLAKLKRDINAFYKGNGVRGITEFYQTDDEKLYATHNMSLAGVKSAIKLGGLAMPSLALRKVSQGNINQFGDIVFVGNERLATPGRGLDVYDRDAWTPSISQQLRYELLPEGNKFVKDVLSKVGRERDLSLFVYNINENITYPQSNSMAIELYALDKGLGEDYDQYQIMKSQDYADWYDVNLMTKAEPYLWTENASNTDMVRKKLTLKNIMQVLKKQEKSGGAWLGNYPDISNILNYFAYKFKNLKEVRKNKDKLVSREQQVEAVGKLNEKFSEIVEAVAELNDKSYFDTLSDVASAIADVNVNASDKLKSFGIKSPENIDEKIKELREGIINVPTDYFEVKPRRIVDFSEFSGVIIPNGKEYDGVADILEKEHFVTVERVEKGNEQDYEKALNNIQENASTTFFQKGTIRRGSYNPTTQVIRLFKEANPSTIIHELGHFFTMKYVRALEETGQQEKLAGFYNWLGINSIDEATTETWEKMARGFETYALEGVAPNASTESVFQRMKQWLIGVYQDLKGKVIPPEEINDDVRAFFDGMLASEQIPVDVSNVKGRTDDLINIINAAMRGEEVAIDGISIKDVNNLIKASNARLPRLPKNLEQAIRAAGGIDIQLAQSLGLYDSRIGNRSGFFKEGGTFTKEDSLIEFLRDEGFLSAPESINYEESAEIQDRAINLLENAAEVFRESDIGTIQQRESLIEAAQEASKLLQKIDYKDVQQAINTLREKSISAVQKDTLKYIKARLNRIDKDYRKIVDNSLRSQRKDIAQKQSDVIAYIREQPISNDHKFRLINEVKKANTEETYEKAINEVKRRADEYYEQEQKKLLTTQIKKEIKKSKPAKATQQRYDYETNKLFQSLREYNKLTQEQASSELEKFIDIEEPQNTDLIKIRFLNYKANGMKSSTQLMEKVLDDILQAKRLGSMLKDQADMEAKINKEELKQEVLEAVKASTADKNSFKTQFTNLYRRGFANLYSMINSIASRKLAVRFEMETVLNDADVAFYKHTDNLTKKVMNVFGIKSRGELLNKFADMGEVVDTIYAENGNKYDVTKLDIVDIYNAIKNEKTRNNYLTAYGEEQVMRVVNMLNQQERLFADVMMDDVNSLYPETNKIYIEAYGMDLKKVENYWPATSEHIKETDLLGDFYVQQETPSFYKERVKGHVIPMPKNAWEKYLKHVNESLYMIKVARKYKELSDTFKSSRVRNQIENKYGKGVYNELMKQINDLSLNAKSESLNYVESAFGSVLNNFVVAKIAIAPTVFAGQLTSITNYSEEVNTADFYKNFAEGLGHPKETIKFMKKYAGDFLETRYKGGYSEALNRVQREAEQANKRKFKILSDKTKYNVTNALTSFVRVGDMGSLIFGGYAQIQTNIKAGMSLDDAVKKFEFDTLRTQQSSNAASLSSFQKSRGFSRVLLAFKNTQHQYLRKLVDSVIQYQRGEISSTQCAKTILNYAVIQGSLYIIAKNAVKAAMGLGDDDDEITDGLLEQLVVGNLDAIPFVSDIARYAYKKAAGEYTHGLLNMPGLDDIERAIMKLYKEDKTIYDWVDIIAPLIEGTTATPVKRYAGMIKKYMEDE